MNPDREIDWSEFKFKEWYDGGVVSSEFLKDMMIVKGGGEYILPRDGTISFVKTRHSAAERYANDASFGSF